MKIIKIRRVENEKLHNYLFKIPPDFEMAKLHGQAMRVRISQEGLNLDEDKQGIDGKRLLPEYTRPLGLCESTQKLIEHGDGFPLLFQYLRFLILMFASIFGILGIYFIIITRLKEGEWSLIELLSVKIIFEKDQNGRPKTDETLLNIYEGLVLFTTLLLIVLISIFWVRQKKLQIDLDNANKTDSDFGVMMYNLPETSISSDLRRGVERNVGIEKDDIVYTNRCYKYDQLLNLKKRQFKWLQLK